HQLDLFLTREGVRGQAELRAVLPVTLLDPLQVRLVAAPIGIRDFSRPTQVRVDAARHRGREPDGPAAVAKLPLSGSQGESFHKEAELGTSSAQTNLPARSFRRKRRISRCHAHPYAPVKRFRRKPGQSGT